MSDFPTDPQSALRASVTATPTGGVAIATTAATNEPGTWPLAIAKGQTWGLFATWKHSDTPRDMSGGTVTLTARTSEGGSAVLSITGSGNSSGEMQFDRTATQTSALDFVRARYVLDYSSGGTVTRLLTGWVDLVNSGLV